MIYTRHMRIAPYPAAGVLMLVSSLASAQVCTLEGPHLDRGETRDFLLCGEDIGPDAILDGLEQQGIQVRYQQFLSKCDVHDERPGFLIYLHAGDVAESAVLTVRGAGSGEPLCRSLEISVPSRLRLPDATLREGEGAHMMQIDAPRGVDFSRACDSGLIFPDEDGGAMEIDQGSMPGEAHCDAGLIRVPVRFRAGRISPVRIIVPGMSLPGSTTVEGISWVTPPEPEWTSSMAESDARFVDIDGIRTRYFESGEGEALVLVHGGQPSSADASAWDWQQNFDALARHFHVYALDRLGQGYTENPQDLDAYADYYPRVAQHVHGFIRAMGIEKAHLVGHSQGGWPVTRIALDHPDLVSSLVIVDSTMMAPASNAQDAVRFYVYISSRLHPEDGETLESIRRGMEFYSYTNNNITEQRIQRILEMSHQPKYALARDWFNENWMNPAHPDYRALKAQAWEEIRDGGLKMPVLIIWGHEDPENSFGAGLEFFRSISLVSPAARFHSFARSGHVPYIEYPEEFNSLVRDFCLQ